MQQQEQQPPVPLLTWSRDAASREGYSDQLTSHPIVRTAKILSLSAANDPANAPLHHGALPEGAELIQIASSVNDLDVHALQQAGVNTIFVSHAVDALADLLHQLPLVQWVHTRSAGVDFIYSAALASWQQQQQHHIMTNARGQFSSTLAEYTMAACSYFAKDFNRLKRNQRDKNWDRCVCIVHSF